MELLKEGQLNRTGRTEITRPDEFVPQVVAEAGNNACFAWNEFFAIDNDNTRLAYENAVRRFLAFCTEGDLQLTQIMPGDVSRYLKQMTNLRTGTAASKETQKLHLSAIRRFFDVLVLRHAILLNPAASVRGPKVTGNEGKTPPIPESKVSVLLGSIDTDTLVGLRDRAILGVLLYTAVRRGAVARLRIKDLWTDGVQHYLRFDEKGGKIRDIPVRHDLHQWLFQYLCEAQLNNESPNNVFFRKAIYRSGQISSDGMSPRNISDLVKRRLKDAGLPNTLKAHSFRATTITNLLSQEGVTLEAVQDLVGHADARTTRRYDHSSRKINRNLVERISF